MAEEKQYTISKTSAGNILFNGFPTKEEFAKAVGCTPDNAELVLRYVEKAVGSKYRVSRNGARMAAIAMICGMSFVEVVPVFASWYEDYKKSYKEMTGREYED